MVSTTTAGMVKRSYCFEPDELTWLKAEAEREDRTVNWILRRLVRAAMTPAAPSAAAPRAAGRR